MAQKQPAKDAVSAAMSAIENALNLSGDGQEAAATPSDSGSGRSQPLPPPIEPPAARRLPPPDDSKSPLVAEPPANDDRAAIGPILQALAVGRPTLAPVIAATVGSLLWLALCGAYVAIHFPWSGGADAVRQYLTRPETVLLALAALGPLILFFGFAALARRLHELRLSARSITQVALRLAEPETVASENVASLAQAIRREIGTMGDGIERALARAAELETLVRSEVTTLERAYSDNERRIRSLIAEMADQREAILASGGRVRAVIDDAHRGIATDLEAIAIRLGERVSGVGGDVAANIGASAEEVTQAMDRAGASAVERINAIATDVTARLAAASGRSAEDIIGRVADIDQRIRTAGEALAADFAGRNEDLVGRIEATGVSAVESLRHHADSIVSQLGAATSAAGHALDEHDHVVVGRIADSGAQAAEAIRLHGDAVATRLSVASESLAREFGQRIDELIERVETSARGISDVVTTHGEGLATRLDLAVDRLHESVVVRGQTLEESLVAANVRFESTMSGKTEDARALFESAGAAWSEHFDARHAQLRELIDDSAGVIGGQIEESARRAADAVAAEAIAAQERLEAAARAALERWTDETRDVSEKFSSAAGEAVAAIAVGGDSMNDALGATITGLEDTLSSRGGALLADLTNQTRRIEEQIGALNSLVGESGESAIERIAAHTERLGESLTSQIESIDSVMSSRKNELDERLNEHQAHFNNRLEEHRSRFDESLSEHRNRFDQTLGDHRQRLEEASAARLAEFESSAAANQTMVELALSTHTRTVDDSLRDGVVALETALTERGRDVVARVEAETRLLTTQLDATLNAIEQTVVVRGGELDQRLARRSQEAAASFDSGIEAADARSTDKLDEVRSAFEKILERIDGVLAARAKSINESLARSTVEAAKTLGDGGREIAQSISAKSAELEATLRGRAEALSQALSELAGDINAKLADRLDDMSGTLGNSVTRFRDDIVAPLHTLATELQSGGTEIAEAIARHSVNLGETVESHVRRIGAESTAQLVARIEELRGLVEGPASDLVAKLGARGDEVADQIAGVSAQASQNFEQQIGNLVALLTRRGDDLLAAITASAGGSVRELGALSGQIGVAVESSTAALRAAAEAAQTQSAEAIGSLITGLSAEVDTSTAALRAAAATAQAQSVQVIGSLVTGLTTEVDTSTAALRAAAEATQAQSAESIGALIGNLTGEIERAGASLREAVETNAGASVTTLNASSERMRAELGQVLERLGQVGSVLDRMVGAAGERLIAVEGGLGERIEQLQRALGAMADQVSALDRLSNETRGESGVLVERLSGHTTALADVARELAVNQQTVDASLALRHASLKALFAEITEKSQEFDAVARHFATSFEESFAKAQARAQEISASLAVSTKNAATNAVSQFEMIRDSAGKERLKTSEALQVAYDQANANLNDVMTKTAERFRESVDEVRQMAAEVQRQLDATRRELKRGVFELPEETAEAATAMRRVVADQIAALKELTAVVTASGADFDVVEPTPARPAPRIEAPRKAEAPRRAAENEDDGQVMTAAPPAPAVEPVHPAAPAAVSRPARPPQPAAATPGERSQSGWLSNLLAAASRDETPAASSASAGRPMNDAPEGISLDVAKFVDTEAAAEMWDRWRAGDAGAATRRLYTAAGQQSFDEIRRRYRSDPQFQDAVNRYTQEFERLLAKVGQNDRDGTQSRTTLLSDAGKVYTMLAHASGRLG